MSLSVEQLKELALFAQTNANNPGLAAWLAAQREKAVTYMVKTHDQNILRRAQGAIEFIDKMTELLASAHTHLR